jgi:uncharacterized protein involved in cysteine biosynthesis
VAYTRADVVIVNLLLLLQNCGMIFVQSFMKISHLMQYLLGGIDTWAQYHKPVFHRKYGRNGIEE